MDGLLYEIGTKSRSARVHRMLYGSASWLFKPANLKTKFRFECKKTGNCCRGRARQSNHIIGLTQISRIVDFCEARRIAVRGLSSIPTPTLDLDGQTTGGTIVADPGAISGHKGIAYSGAHVNRDCQFLQENLCSIHPVKPFLCALAPVGLVFEHLQYRGRLLFAVSSKPECPECSDGREWTVGEWLDKTITVVDFNDWINDMRENARWSKLSLNKGSDT